MSLTRIPHLVRNAMLIFLKPKTVIFFIVDIAVHSACLISRRLYPFKIITGVSPRNLKSFMMNISALSYCRKMARSYFMIKQDHRHAPLERPYLSRSGERQGRVEEGREGSLCPKLKSDCHLFI